MAHYHIIDRNMTSNATVTCYIRMNVNMLYDYRW